MIDKRLIKPGDMVEIEAKPDEAEGSSNFFVRGEVRYMSADDWRKVREIRSADGWQEADEIRVPGLYVAGFWIDHPDVQVISFTHSHK